MTTHKSNEKILDISLQDNKFLEEVHEKIYTILTEVDYYTAVGILESVKQMIVMERWFPVNDGTEDSDEDDVDDEG